MRGVGMDWAILVVIMPRLVIRVSLILLKNQRGRLIVTDARSRPRADCGIRSFVRRNSRCILVVRCGTVECLLFSVRSEITTRICAS